VVRAGGRAVAATMAAHGFDKIFGPDPELRQVPVELVVVGAGYAEDRVDAVGGQSGHDGATTVAEALGPAHRRTPRASPAGPVGSAEPFFSAAHSDRIS